MSHTNKKNDTPRLDGFEKRRAAAIISVVSLFLACLVALVAAQVQFGGERLRVGSLKGPTTVGLAPMIQTDAYDTKVFTTGDELVQKLLTKDIDIALLPSNTAANLYAKTNGEITVLNINTLSPMYITTRDEAIQDFHDLDGKTVYMTGKATTPEYTMRYLAESYGVTVDLQFKSEPTEVASLLVAEPDAIGLLPEPFASSVISKNNGIRLAFNLDRAWIGASPEGSQIVTGVTVVRNEVLNARGTEIDHFLAEEQNSVTQVINDPTYAAKTLVEKNIFPTLALAEQAIPRCATAFISGEPMKKNLGAYLEVMYQQNPASVGGALPGGDFYYSYQDEIVVSNAQPYE